MADCQFTFDNDTEAKGEPRPSCQVSLAYLAEGAANVIYSVSTVPNSEPCWLSAMVLRFRKSSTTRISCQQTFESLQREIVPLFKPEELLRMCLFQLPSQSIISDLNSALRSREGKGARPLKRKGVYLSEEPHALAIQDMTPRQAHEILVEFKPKWLVQSPSAPLYAQRCRTCALRLMRAAKKDEKGRGDAGFCPLDLFSTDSTTIAEALAHIWTPAHNPQDFQDQFIERVQPVLRHLRALQTRFIGVGASDFATNENFSVAMALRDCSVFLLIHHSPVELKILDVKLADLDLKPKSEEKIRQWTSTEESLASGGWYQGIENAGSKGTQLCKSLRPE